MKKALLILLLIVGAFLFVGCSSTEVANKLEFDSLEEAYAFTALTSTSLLDESLGTSTRSLRKLGTTYLSEDVISDEEVVELPEETEEPVQEEELVVEEEIDEVNKYLNMMETFLGNNNGLSVAATASDLEGYQFKLEFVTKNMLGEDVKYIIYYNEVLEEEVTDELLENEEEKDQEPEVVEEETETEEETEKEYVLDGIMIINDVQYELTGKREIEGTEEELVLISRKDKNNYVKVVYKVDEEETKFRFEIKVEGKPVSRTEVKVETEDNKLKATLKFVEGKARGQYTFRTATEGNQEFIHIKYNVTNEFNKMETGNIKVLVTVDEETGETSYEYLVNCENKNVEKEFHKDRYRENQEKNQEKKQGHKDEKGGKGFGFGGNKK